MSTIPERRVRPAGHRHVKVLRWIIPAAWILDEKQILPLQEPCDAHIETEVVGGHVDSRTRSEIVVGEL